MGGKGRNDECGGSEDINGSGGSRRRKEKGGGGGGREGAGEGDACLSVCVCLYVSEEKSGILFCYVFKRTPKPFVTCGAVGLALTIWVWMVGFLNLC